MRISVVATINPHVAKAWEAVQQQGLPLNTVMIYTEPATKERWNG